MIHHPGHLIPEGKFKEFTKKVYRLLIEPYNFVETKLPGNVYRYKFKNGVDIKLNGCEFLDISSPLRGYLRRYKPKKGDVILDLGSFNGMFSVYSSQLVGKEGKIYAFEPNKKNFLKLRKNIALNKIKNIIPVNMGMWNKETTLKLSDDTSLSSVIYNEHNKKTVKIKVTTLNNFVKKNKINKIDLIKMDVEGAELEILDAGVESIKKFMPRFAIASYHERNGEKTYKEVERKLRKLGYKTTTGFPSHLTTYAWK